MTTIFDEVHGFNLKLPYDGRNYTSSPYGEWIEITKKPNELPTVKLRTVVLYYRNDGLDTGIFSNNGSNIKTSVTGGTVDDGNYRFYNDINTANGRQLGWIWGFPLFDVGRDSTNWPRFHSCIGSDRAGFSGTDICGNETMLVDISAKKNIIVLNFEGLGSTIFNQIKNNIPGITDAFFMTLRIKSSKESDFSTYSHTNGVGNGGSWNLYYHNTRQVTRWASIIQYEYECDIIGPKAMLDFTLNYFMYSNSGKGEIINTASSNDYNDKELLQLSNGNTDVNNATGENPLYILTGLGVPNQSRYRMDIEDILKNLSRTISNSFTYLYLQIKDRCIIGQSGRDGANTIKLIGGWWNRGRANNITERNIGYYGDNFGTGDRQTKMTNSNSTHETEGWKRFIELRANPSTNPNQWIDDESTSYYEFNNILWCSLRSPRKIPVTKRRTNNNDTVSYGIHRFITNFIDLSGGVVTSNKIIGGGYGRYSNTIDIPRQSKNPYFSSTATQNTNTVSIANFNVNENINYLDADSTALSLNDLNYFTVYYKLLVPLDANKIFNIKYTFGRDSDCVTTFVRHNDMSGNSTPAGNTNKSAVRDEESIELTWKDASIDANGNMPIQSISFTDIASGFKRVAATFNITDVSLNEANNSTEYDISFNVFQFHFLATLGNTIITDRQEIPYSVKTFDTNVSIPQVIDISYVPQNYKPYRYINYSEYNNTSIESSFYFNKNDYSDGPLKIREENLNLKLAKYYAKTGNNLGNLKSIPSLIDPSNTKFIPNASPGNIINIDISSNVFDNSFSLVGVNLPEEAMNGTGAAPADFPISKEEIIFLSVIDTNAKLLTNTEEEESFQSAGGQQFGIFYSPNVLDLSGYLIPDYWRLPDKINTLRISGLNDSPLSYGYFNDWQNQIQIAMVLDVLSISLKFEDKATSTPSSIIEYLLVNTNENSSDYSSMTSGGFKVDNASNNLIFEVQGANGLINGQYLNQKPIIVQLFTITSGPFGPSAKAFIGNKNGSGTTGIPPATADKGINVPFPAQTGLAENNSNYIVNEFLPGIMRKGNGGGGANLGLNEKSYNDAYDINLSAWDDGGSNIQNASFNGTSMSPSPLKTLLVDLPNVSQTNANPTDMINDANNAITINWTSFFFSTDISWNSQNSNVFWTITKLNISTGDSIQILTDEILPVNGNNEYSFTDASIRIYDKVKYTVTGRFKWVELSNITNNNDVPSLSIPGFTTPECFACKFNRFPFGRFNTTSTNLKLFRPLLINTPEGQVNQFGERTCGGGCRDPNNPQLNLYSTGSRISSSNNIYANTTNQVSKKQTYVILAKSRFRPFR